MAERALSRRLNSIRCGSGRGFGLALVLNGAPQGGWTNAQPCHRERLFLCITRAYRAVDVVERCRNGSKRSGSSLWISRWTMWITEHCPHSKGRFPTKSF
ncbi:hypothetical protein TC41_0496 [Alicyclobacillus acidocaldarius subsp. acidocaldarius Tc-4-1]|uniref:Uncharacterized protein n=1 Tax=Alicyclobacillus acidocaldarius (strain Tc-4-1) TaxID=1048834 RepID=F8ICI3_ALIAT|nr:hypothetical protein TC41_0496 [Alicyclobacillus acidocaldarius subsp. acidocaldarius Tc-4-1]